MDLIVEALNFAFFQRALMAGVALAIVYPLLGSFVVLRQEAVIGHTMANLVFLGITISLLFNWNFSLLSFLMAFLGVLFITYLQSSERFSQDSVLNLTAEIAMGGAIVVLSQLQGYQNIEGFLFGNILAVSQNDLWITLILVLVNLIVLYFIRKPLMRIVINRDLALSAGTNVNLTNFIFMLLLAFTVALGIKIIGVILLGAFLVIPANTAKLLASSFKKMMLFSVIVAVLGVLIGLFASYFLDTPSGAMIVLVLGLLLVLATLFKKG